MTLFGTTAAGQDVHKITLTAGDLTVSLLTRGAVVQDVRLAGIDHALTLGSDKLADYEGDLRHHGALIGPVVNRISTARARLDGMMYELERNQDGRIHLHSGSQGTHLQVWDVVKVTENAATLMIVLPDGMCGLPGNRRVEATFTVTNNATLTLDITAITDSTTLMNFANHSYWNLDGSATYDGHSLQVAADHYLPTTADFCPTGEVVAVADTPMDFRTKRILAVNQPAFDNNFCLSDSDQPIRDVLTLTGKRGLRMTMATTASGLQIYDGRNLPRPGRQCYEGLAIEAQGWPDAPNNPDFPTIKVNADKPYRQTTSWRFENLHAKR